MKESTPESDSCLKEGNSVWTQGGAETTTSLCPTHSHPIAHAQGIHRCWR
jgi:hypothetical protein